MKKLTIEVWSDIVCPFCYIGKRRLEAALAQFDHASQVDVVWKSFQLNPKQVTNASISVTQDLANKKGWTLEYARDMSEYVTDMAAEEGLMYDFNKAVTANSLNAHRLLQFAKTHGKGSETKEALLRAYFTEGKNIDDAETLLNLALEIGLPAEQTKQVLANPFAYKEAVAQDLAEAEALGIAGVPFFVLNRKYGISGAQELSVFSNALQKAWADEVAV